MKNCILFTLGHRDLQFTQSIPYSYKNWLMDNHEDLNTQLIQTTNSQISFLEISKAILDDIDNLVQFMICPMIEQTLEKIGAENVDIFFSTSEQDPMDKKDCKFIAEICRKIYFSKGFNVIIRNFVCSPVNFEPLTDFYIDLLNELKVNYQKVFISNSGGTPDMRAATYAAGFFKGFEYVHINSRTKKSSSNTFIALENKVLHNIVENMLQVYDFEGIRKLPVGEMIKNIAIKAIANYNLDLEKQTIESTYQQDVADAFELLIDNMRVCYEQGRYVEAMGRLFRIEEEFWYLLYYKFLQNEGIIDANNPKKIEFMFDGKRVNKKIEVFFNFDFHYNAQFLSLKYAHLLTMKDNITYLITGQSFNPEVPLRGKNWYYFFYKQINFYDEACDFFANLNMDENQNPFTQRSKLNQLRNSSYAGHGYKGVNKEDFDGIIAAFGNYQKFDEKLRAISSYYTGKEMKKIFEDFAQQIRTLISQ